MKLPIYLDYSATTPVDPRVAEKMIPYLCEHFGNPASRSHSFGWVADAAVEEAREQVADLVGADPKEIVWTSGATESNNLAIKGAANFYAGTKGKHIITVKTEHKAVLDTVRELERQGFEATYLDVQENGLLDIEVFKAAIRPDTARKVLARCMFAASRASVLKRKCMAVAMNAASARGRCRPIRSWVWVNVSVWPRKKWLKKTSGLAPCVIGCSRACRTWKRPSSMAISNTVSLTT